VKIQTDEVYVLHTQELGDADLIVTLLARQHGQVRWRAVPVDPGGASAAVSSR
jgi:hypothetical protein